MIASIRYKDQKYTEDTGDRKPEGLLQLGWFITAASLDSAKVQDWESGQHAWVCYCDGVKHVEMGLFLEI